MQLIDRVLGLPSHDQQLLLRILIAIHFGDAQAATTVRQLLREYGADRLTQSELNALLPKLGGGSKDAERSCPTDPSLKHERSPP
jgi:hypothetical protein